MASLMKATQPHWLGNKFVPAGNVLPAGHSEALPEFYEPYEIEEPPDLDALRAQAEALGVKVDKRWGADRLSDEIAANSKAAG